MKSVFGIHNPKGLSYLAQLRAGLSKLNFHKFKHNFRDTINPMCLFAGIVELIRPFIQITDLSNDSLTEPLLYDDQDLSNGLNRNVLEFSK